MKYLNTPLGIFLQRCAVLVFVPLLGWGVNDLKEFFDDFFRAGLLFTAVVMNGYVAYKYGKRKGFKNQKRKKIIKRQHFIIFLFQGIYFLFLITIPFFARRNLYCLNSVFLVKLTGLFVFFAGLVLIYEAKKKLGRFFSGEVQLIENHKLLADGYYKYIRHPRYLGELLLMVGFALVFGVWIGFLFVFVLFLILSWRISDEEKMMHEEFGKEWEEYSSKTKKLLPFVY